MRLPVRLASSRPSTQSPVRARVASPVVMPAWSLPVLVGIAALNDRDADGRDVSWIWDSDFEALVPAVEHAVITGLRAHDLALRFKDSCLTAVPQRLPLYRDEPVGKILRFWVLD